MKLTKTPLPQLIFTTIYMSLVYSLQYLTFAAFPISFLYDRHWSLTHSSLPFLALMSGVWLSNLLTAIYTKRYYLPRLIRRRGVKCPEDRLPMAVLGAAMLPVSLFWFGWSSHPSTNAAAQIVAAVFLGCANTLIL